MTLPIVQNCFIAGASRGVGFEVAKLLLQKGHTVATLIRTDDLQPQLEALGAQVLVGDALDEGFVETAVQCFDDAPFALVTTIGGKGMERNAPRSDYLGNRNLIDAVKPLHCARFLLVSSIGVRESAVALPDQVLATLRPALLAKAKAEEHLLASGLPFTIVRPGGLLSEPPTGKGIVTENAMASGSITRVDVANLVWQCLQSDAAANKVFSAVDSDRLRGDRLIEPFLL